MAIDVFTAKHAKPRRRFHIFAPVFFPFDVELWRFIVAQDFCRHEEGDVQAHAVVQVGRPVYGMLGQRFPAHEDVVAGFAVQFAFLNHQQATFEILRGRQAQRHAISAAAHTRFLLAHPAAQVGVDEAA